MNTYLGDIWALESTHIICVPINLGWTTWEKLNVMGTGIAKQAKERFPQLPELLGHYLFERFSPDPIRLSQAAVRDGVAIFFSLLGRNGSTLVCCMGSKPLSPEAPWLSWAQKSDLNLIESSVRYAVRFRADYGFVCPLAVPLIGAGNGQLPTRMVYDRLSRILQDTDATLVMIDNIEGSGK